jgi:hypothetical protein
LPAASARLTASRWVICSVGTVVSAGAFAMCHRRGQAGRHSLSNPQKLCSPGTRGILIPFYESGAATTRPARE